MSHNTLANYYTTIFAMAQHHKYSITEIEDMLPFERDLYIDLLMAYLDKEKDKLAEEI